MSTATTITYALEDRKHQRHVDPDKFGYLDIIYDVYYSVLRHIPPGRTVKFSVKYIISEKNEEISIANDDDVLKMFRIHEKRIENVDKPIDLLVHEVKVTVPNSMLYYINGYPSAVIGRDESEGKEVDIFGNVEDVMAIQQVENLIDLTEDVVDIEQVATGDTMVGNDSENYESFRDDSTDDSTDEDYNVQANEVTGNSDSGNDGLGHEDEEDGDGILDSDGSEGDSNGEFSDCHLENYYEVKEKNYEIDQMEKIELHVGLCFNTVDEFRLTLKECNIQEGTDILRVKNDRDRVIAVCASDGCQWRIHASQLSDKRKFMVKSYYGEHTCTREPKIPNADSKWIATKLASRLRADPDMKISSMHAALNAKYGIDPDKQQLYRARKIAKRETEDCFMTSYV
ncbi:hypothetical protein NE237_008742 [Protea cynaroides]|uniref:Transposase MuDR plant domain-containing protein n=1 Tax=Protea cynaroides TaxID=273540 RepID=A0A9Q0KW57_9MAGN|nr:hypothetical protein NE237_008742 [Protea cynaroides]